LLIVVFKSDSGNSANTKSVTNKNSKNKNVINTNTTNLSFVLRSIESLKNKKISSFFSRCTRNNETKVYKKLNTNDHDIVNENDDEEELGEQKNNFDATEKNIELVSKK
jgi:hypothetical protein